LTVHPTWGESKISKLGDLSLNDSSKFRPVLQIFCSTPVELNRLFRAKELMKCPFQLSADPSNGPRGIVPKGDKEPHFPRPSVKVC
jgi:hypothetical protein